MGSFTREPCLHHGMTPQMSSFGIGRPSVLICQAPTEGLPTHSVSLQGPSVPLSSRNVASSMPHREPASLDGLALESQLVWEQSGCRLRTEERCCMYLAPLLGVPRPGPCAGLAGTAVSDFPLLIHCGRLLQFSLLRTTHAPEIFSSVRLRHGGRCTVEARSHGQDPASAILPPAPMLC